MGFAPSDLGLTPALQAALTQPAPWSSLAPLDTDFTFALILPQPTKPDALEPGISVAPRGTTTALGGAFSWKQTGAVEYQLTFIPSAQLTDNTDYVVSVADPSGGAPLVQVGFSTGSHPRVIAAILHGENQAARVYFDVTFSEPMDVSTFVGRVNVTAGSPAVAVAGASSTPAGVQLRYELTNGKLLKSPIKLHLTVGVKSSAGIALDPASWDAPTQDVSGDFAVSVDNPGLDNNLSIDLPMFTPVVN